MTEVKIIIPETLNEIPLNKYLEWTELSEGAAEHFVEARLLHIFCGIRPHVSKEMVRNTRTFILNELAKTLSQKPEFQPTFKFNGLEWGIIPNFDEMTTAEFVDLDSVIDYQKD